MSHYVIVQFTVLYIGVVESRQRTRAGLPNLFCCGSLSHEEFFAGHKRFCDVTISYCDVTNLLILIRFMR